VISIKGKCLNMRVLRGIIFYIFNKKNKLKKKKKREQRKNNDLGKTKIYFLE